MAGVQDNFLEPVATNALLHELMYAALFHSFVKDHAGSN
jgi:hypothetical protein